MKKFLKISVVIVLIIVVLGLLGIVACYLTYPKYSITLHAKDTSFTYHLLGDKTYHTISDNVITVDSHVYLKTDNTVGMAYLPDESILFLEPNTQLRIDIDKTGTYIKILKGAVYNNVTPQGGKKYQVQTPHMIDQVQGTDFLVYVWSPGDNSYVLQAPGAAGAWNSGSGTNVAQGRVGTTVEIRERFNDSYDETNVPEGPLQPIIGTINIIIPNGRSPYDVAPDAVDTGDGWSHLDAGGNTAVNGTDGTTTSSTSTTGQTSNITSRRELTNQLRQLESDYRSGRITREEYNRRLQELLNSPAGRRATDSLSSPASSINNNIDEWDCPYFEANVKPVVNRVLTRVYADDQTYYIMSGMIPRGVEYYDHFINHVCDDGGLDESEKAYIREVGSILGTN